MKGGRKVFWGVLFLLGAAALIVGNLGYLEEFNFWTVLLSIGLIGLFVEGLLGRNFGTMLFSLAFLGIVNGKLLGLEEITPWALLGAALLGSIGLNMLFPKKDRWKEQWNKRTVNEETKTEGSYGENVNFEVTFGGAVRYVTSTELRSIKADCSFGSLEIYLNNAILKEHQAMVNVDCSFGSVVLYVPSDWKVLQQAKASLGGIDEKGFQSAKGENTLIISGSVSFGALEIRYI